MNYFPGHEELQSPEEFLHRWLRSLPLPRYQETRRSDLRQRWTPGIEMFKYLGVQTSFLGGTSTEVKIVLKYFFFL